MTPHHRDNLYLAIDCGSQSLRALVFDMKGALLAMEQVVFRPYDAPKPGWSEQDPAYFFDCLAEACQTLMAQHPELQLQKNLKAVALTTQRGTVVSLDDKGVPLRPAISWMDGRIATKPPRPSFYISPILKLLQADDLIEHVTKNAEANWIYQHQPEIWQKTAHFLLLSGYLSFRLTGEVVDSVGCQVGFLPFDYKRQRWLPRHHWQAKLVKVGERSLPRLKSPMEVLGCITSAASQKTGIPEGLPLIAAAADKACEVLGSGCLTDDRLALSFGTTATVNLMTQKFIEPLHHLPSYPAAIARGYNAEIQVQRGFWLISWFKEQFGHAEVKEAEELGSSAEEIFNRQIKSIPPGSDGLLIQPFWAPGVKFPPKEAKGAMIGFHDGHTKAHIYRALIEGLVFALKQGGDMIVHRSKSKAGIRQLHIAGGGAKSDEAMQIAANVFGKASVRPHTHEASGLGAAICAAVGTGAYAGVEEAVTNMVHIKDRFEPEEAHVKTYDDIYHHLFLPLFNTIRPLYQSIKSMNFDNLQSD